MIHVMSNGKQKFKIQSKDDKKERKTVMGEKFKFLIMTVYICVASKL